MCRNQKDVDTRIHNMCMAAKTNEEDMLELGENIWVSSGTFAGRLRSGQLML